MKTNKIIVVTKEKTLEIGYRKEFDLSDQQWIEVAKDVVKCDVEAVYDAHTHHICKYCGDIANGCDDDVLCDDCKEIFGHSFYSQL